jgi:type II secretory pathway component PulC
MAIRKLIGLWLLGSAALAGPASAKDTAVWSSFVDEQAASLNFSTPESDDVRFVLYCEHATKKVSVTVNRELKGVKDKAPLTVDLSVGAAKVSLKGVAVTNENDGYIYGEANDIAVAPVTEVLRAPGTLNVKLAGKSFSFPENGRAKNLKVFEDGCKAK